jgi:predicted nucleic acid-binding protein
VADRRVLADTGPLVAIASEDDAHHRACVEALAALPPPVLTCWPVLTEAAWLLRKRPTARDRLFEAFDAGMLTLLDLGPEALGPIAKFLRRYEAIGAQLADAALVYLAEREDIREVFTLDRRDFSVYRIGRHRTFKIIPEVT